MNGPRNAEYYLLRCRERLHLSGEEMEGASYEEQLKLISFELLRQLEERQDVSQIGAGLSSR